MTARRDIPVLLSKEEIADRIKLMAKDINEKMSPQVIVVALLKGSFIFVADLVREIHEGGSQIQMDFLTLSSYGSGTESSGKVRIVSDMAEEVKGKHVLIVDDILESGRTLHFARELMMGRGAASVQIAVLLEKPGKRDMSVNVDFIGFSIPDRFVVGYGLDYAGHYRELPYIGVVEIH